MMVSSTLNVKQSHAFCRRIVQQSGSSFRKSFTFLRADAQQAMHTLYAFARLVDDLADNFQYEGGEADEAIQQINHWLNQIEDDRIEPLIDVVPKIGELVRSFNFIAPSLHDMILRFYINVDQLRALVEGAAFDMRPEPRIQSVADLNRYCHWVATSVGLTCIQIWRGDYAKCLDAAVECSLAFQKTNILRDVAEDARRGRIYLPEEEFAKFDCDTTSWLQGKPNGEWRSMMLNYVDQAGQHYAASRDLRDQLPADAARMFSLMWNSYRQLLSEVASGLDRVWVERIRLPYKQKLKLYLSHAISPIFERRK
jgi:15-cis-phytoene synthase